MFALFRRIKIIFHSVSCKVADFFSVLPVAVILAWQCRQEEDLSRETHGLVVLIPEEVLQEFPKLALIPEPQVLYHPHPSNQCYPNRNPTLRSTSTGHFPLQEECRISYTLSLRTPGLVFLMILTQRSPRTRVILE